MLPGARAGLGGVRHAFVGYKRDMSDTTPRRVGTTLAALRKWNLGVGLAHLVQAIAILLLSNDFSIAVEGKVQTGPPGSALEVDKVFFDLPYAPIIAVFLLLAAVDHLLMATIARGWYERTLARGINPARWIEYSISASLMIVLIAMLPGITNLYALMGLFGVNAAMILFGWLMERENPPGQPVSWWAFGFGCVAGAVPWIAITTAIVVSEVDGEDGVPGFVYGIFVSLFLLFNCFAIAQWLQYRRKGRFADYLYGEKVYLVLSLVAKTALAWQVFAGTLAD
jgi:Heliorhodopsin